MGSLRRSKYKKEARERQISKRRHYEYNQNIKKKENKWTLFSDFFPTKSVFCMMVDAFSV